LLPTPIEKNNPGGKSILPFFLLSVNLLVNMVQKNIVVCRV
jgi:hypothetical protein